MPSCATRARYPESLISVASNPAEASFVQYGKRRIFDNEGAYQWFDCNTNLR